MKPLPLLPLLASLVWEDHEHALATLNIYPGLLRIAGRSPGLWVSAQRGGRFRAGLTTPLGVGTGIGQVRARATPTR